MIRCRTAQRRALTQHIPFAFTLLLTLASGLLGGFIMSGGGLKARFDLGPASDARIAAPSRGLYVSESQPEVSAPAIAAPSPERLAKQEAQNRLILRIFAVVVALLVIIGGPIAASIWLHCAHRPRQRGQG